jgi:O-antigen ligase
MAAPSGWRSHRAFKSAAISLFSGRHYGARAERLMIERVAWMLLCVFIFTIPWEKSVWVPGIGTAARLSGVLAFAAGVAAAIRHRANLRRPNLVLVVALLFTVWSAATWFWSLDRPATAARAATFAQLLAMAWLVWESCRTEDEQRQLLHAYVAGAVLASAATIVRYAQGVQTYWRRYAASGFDPNDLGLTIALAVPMALYLTRNRAGVSPWLYRGAIAMIGVAVLLTASRTALVVTLVAFMFVPLTWRESDAAQKLSAAVLFTALLLGAGWFAPAAARERIATLPREISRGTLHNRTTIWKAGLKAVKQHPIVGVGSGAYADAVRPWIGVPSRAGHEYVAHNTFLSVLVETGLVGFGLFGLLLALLAVFVWMQQSAESALWGTTLAVWGIGAATLTWEHRKPTWLLFALIMTEWTRAFRRPAA